MIIENNITLIKKIIYYYIRDEKTIILAVIPSNTIVPRQFTHRRSAYSCSTLISPILTSLIIRTPPLHLYSPLWLGCTFPGCAASEDINSWREEFTAARTGPYGPQWTPGIKIGSQTPKISDLNSFLLFLL